MVMATETQTPRIITEVQRSVARVSLYNAPLNVINLEMMDELAQAVSDIESRSEISTIVISGHGSSFSAGVDVAAHTPDKVEAMLSKFHAVIRALVNTTKVTIAAVNGHCLGGGAELAMVCDLVYTTEEAQWGFPEIKLGCYPPVAVTALAALVGQKRAADLILTGRTINGKEAASIGLANRAVPPDQLDSVAEEAVAQLSKLSPDTLAVTKKAIYAWDSIHFDKGLARAEKIYLDELMKTEDTLEGMNAFLEKREPQWKRK
jgi:cyclohexa-1,5-dienecarbonyl-CoA hydratase